MLFDCHYFKFFIHIFDCACFYFDVACLHMNRSPTAHTCSRAHRRPPQRPSSPCTAAQRTSDNNDFMRRLWENRKPPAALCYCLLSTVITPATASSAQSPQLQPPLHGHHRYSLTCYSHRIFS